MFPTKGETSEYKLITRSQATVIDNRDPLYRGRIRVKHPIISSANGSDWIQYLATPQSFNVPSIGDIVFVECEAGVPTHAVAHGNNYKESEGNVLINDVFRRAVPTNRGWATPGGHLIELDDGIANLTDDPNDTDFTTESRGIRITSKAGNKIHILEDEDQSIQKILIQDKNENKFELDYTDNKVSIVSKDKFDVNITGDETRTIGGTSTTTVTGNWKIEGSAETRIISPTEHFIDAPIVHVGKESAAFHAVIAESLVAYNDEHQHPAIPPLVGGPVLPPVVKMSDKAGTVMDVTALNIFLKGNA